MSTVFDQGYDCIDEIYRVFAHFLHFWQTLIFLCFVNIFFTDLQRLSTIAKLREVDFFLSFSCGI